MLLTHKQLAAEYIQQTTGKEPGEFLAQEIANGKTWAQIERETRLPIWILKGLARERGLEVVRVPRFTQEPASASR